jgi:uncharacterized protein YxeA
MKKNITNSLLEYLSATLIISYFFINNILLVFIGIIFSFYLINIDFFNNLIRSINKHIITEKESKDLNKNRKGTKSDSLNKKLIKEDSNITLVETIEELGFIPLIDENDDISAA